MTDPQFFNSAIVPVPERLILAGGGWRPIEIGVRYGLIEHPEAGPVLIDTGYAPRATTGPRSAMLKLYTAMLRPRLMPATLPLAVLAAKGIRPDDIRLIVLTHFHPDHIAGLKDFPNAKVLASAGAFRQIEKMSGPRRLRHGVFAELLPADFAARLVAIEDRPTVPLPRGLGVGWDVFGDRTCVAVDLPGHALGHFGLVWPERALLYAVDTQWLPPAVMGGRFPHGPAQLIYANDAAMRASTEKVRRFAEQGGEVLLCHEPVTP